MTKSQEIIDKLFSWSFLRPSKEPMFKQIEKIPASLREELKEVKSDELAQTRIDAT